MTGKHRNSPQGFWSDVRRAVVIAAVLFVVASAIGLYLVVR